MGLPRSAHMVPPVPQSCASKTRAHSHSCPHCSTLFSRTYERNRHVKQVHLSEPPSGNTNVYRCISASCTAPRQGVVERRRDKFRDHVNRYHLGVEVDWEIERSKITIAEAQRLKDANHYGNERNAELQHNISTNKTDRQSLEGPLWTLDDSLSLDWSFVVEPAQQAQSRRPVAVLQTSKIARDNAVLSGDCGVLTSDYGSINVSQQRREVQDGIQLCTPPLHPSGLTLDEHSLAYHPPLGLEDAVISRCKSAPSVTQPCNPIVLAISRPQSASAILNLCGRGLVAHPSSPQGNSQPEFGQQSRPRNDAAGTQWPSFSNNGLSAGSNGNNGRLAELIGLGSPFSPSCPDARPYRCVFCNPYGPPYCTRACPTRKTFPSELKIHHGSACPHLDGHCPLIGRQCHNFHYCRRCFQTFDTKQLRKVHEALINTPQRCPFKCVARGRCPNYGVRLAAECAHVQNSTDEIYNELFRMVHGRVPLRSTNDHMSFNDLGASINDGASVSTIGTSSTASWSFQPPPTPNIEFQFPFPAEPGLPTELERFWDFWSSLNTPADNAIQLQGSGQWADQNPYYPGLEQSMETDSPASPSLQAFGQQTSYATLHPNEGAPMGQHVFEGFPGSIVTPSGNQTTADGDTNDTQLDPELVDEIVNWSGAWPEADENESQPR